MDTTTTTTYVFRYSRCKTPLPNGRFGFCDGCEKRNWHYCPGYTQYGHGIYSADQQVPERTCQMFTTNKELGGLCNHCRWAGRHVCITTGCSVTLPKENRSSRCDRHTFLFGMAKDNRPRAKIVGDGYGARVEWYTRRYKQPFFVVEDFKNADIAKTFLRALVDEDGNRAWDDQAFIELVAETLKHGRSKDNYGWDDCGAEDGWGEVPFLGYSDYSGSLLDVSNTETLYEEWSKAFPDDVRKQYDGHGTVWVYVNIRNRALMGAVNDAKRKLDDYPVYNEDDWSNRESEAKEEYFNEYVYKDLMAYAVAQRIPELTGVFRNAEGQLVRRFIDLPRVKFALQYAAEEFIEDEGGHGPGGMYMGDQHIPEVIENATNPEGWIANYHWNVRVIRERVDRLQRWLALPRHGAVQASFLAHESEGQSYYDPSRYGVARIVDTEGELRAVLVPRSDPEPVYVEDKWGDIELEADNEEVEA